MFLALLFLLGEKIIFRKRWICQKCGYVQVEDYDLFHRCTRCGSIDIELKILQENMLVEDHQLVISQ